MEEIWLPIKGFEGMYEVSSLGRVKSLLRTKKAKSNGIQIVKERILKPNIKARYHLVHLTNNEINKSCSIHRLVAIAFIPNPENKETVNHIDGNKKNNLSTNLEWNTQKENILHSFAKGLQNTSKGQDHYLAKLKNKDVRAIRRMLERKINQQIIADKFNVARTLISRIKNKRRWGHLL